MNNIVSENTPQYNPLHGKQCTGCRKWLPFSDFSKARKTKDGLNWRCRKCKLKHQRENRTPEVGRSYQLKSVYGITLKQYNRMLEEQDYVCAVCKMPETHPNNHSKTGAIRRLSVDHDHKTGDVRALLCSGCNVALGRMREDPDRIRALADYAEWCQKREPNEKIVQLSLFS